MKAINHVLLEVFCRKDCQAPGERCPDYCPSQGAWAGYPCLFHGCKYVDFTSCENTLCYIGPDSDEVYGISMGEEENLDSWKEIAVRKIDEAYDEYMAQHPPETDN